MIQLDYRSSVTIYDQLINGIIRLKMVGALKGGDSLPSVKALASQLGINPNTVQKAYAILEQKGLTYSIPAKGSYVGKAERTEEIIKKKALDMLCANIAEALKAGITKKEIIELTENFKEDTQQ